MENCGRFSKSESLGCLNCPFDCGILVKQQVYIISFLVKLEGIGPVEVVFFCLLFLFSLLLPRCLRMPLRWSLLKLFWRDLVFRLCNSVSIDAFQSFYTVILPLNNSCRWNAESNVRFG